MPARYARYAVPLALALLAGCAETQRYVYTPTEHATASLPESGLPAALYQVPPESPQGEVKVASLGVRQLDDQGLVGRHLVVRVIVTNNSDQPWVFDGSQQQVSITGGPPISPVRIYGAEPQESWMSTVPARQQRTFDLVYPVGDARVTSFQLAWNVNLQNRWISQRTSFRRDEVAPQYAGYGYYGPYPYGMYWGAYYDPFYPYGYGTVWVRPRPYHHHSYNYGNYGNYGYRAAPPPPSVRIAPPPPARVAPPAPRMMAPSPMRIAPPPPARR